MNKDYKILDKCNEEDKNKLYTYLYDSDLDDIEYILEAYNNKQISLKDNELVINDNNYKTIGYGVEEEVILWYENERDVGDLIQNYQLYYEMLEEMEYEQAITEQYYEQY